MEKTIVRQNYLDRITPFIGKDLIKVLIGARRVGKTTILHQIKEYILEKDKDANIVYIDKERYEFKSIQTADDLYNYVIKRTISNKQNYIFIDEIQEIDDFETGLRNLFAEKNDIYCTGSNAKMLSGDLATYLSGRYIEFQIFSLSYSEFLEFHKLENENSGFMKYIKYGGLPYLVHLQLIDEIVYGYLRSIYNTIILKDVVSRYSIRDIDFLERLVEYLSDNLGSYVSSKKISDFIKSQRVGLSVNTVLNYLKFLANSFFIHKVSRYDIIGKKKFEINEKYYFEDTGLKHSIIPYKPDDIGKLFENLVYNKLNINGFMVYVGRYRDREIDFVAKKGDKTLYIQVAYLLTDSKVHEREFGNLLKIDDNHRKVVVSMDEFAESNFKGVEHIHIRKFLTDEI